MSCTRPASYYMIYHLHSMNAMKVSLSLIWGCHRLGYVCMAGWVMIESYCLKITAYHDTIYILCYHHRYGQYGPTEVIRNLYESMWTNDKTNHKDEIKIYLNSTVSFCLRLFLTIMVKIYIHTLPLLLNKCGQIISKVVSFNYIWFVAK